MQSTNRAVRHCRLAAIALSLIMISACRDTLGPNGRGVARTSNLAAALQRTNVAVNHSEGARKLPDEYIVVFDQTVKDVHGRATVLAAITGGSIKYEYSTAIRGYAAHMSPQAAIALSSHPGVAYVEQDQVVSLSGTQTALSGVSTASIKRTCRWMALTRSVPMDQG